MRKANAFLYGFGGTGKTCSIATLLKPEQLEKTPDINIKFLSTETNAIYGIEDGLRIHNIKPKEGQLQVMSVRPKFSKKNSYSQIADNFQQNFLNHGDAGAASVKVETGDRSYHKEYLNILYAAAAFKGIDMASNEVVDSGDVLNFDSNTVFVLDSLTTVVNFLLKAVRGPRVIALPMEYSTVQSNLVTNILTPLTESAACSFILIGHAHLGKNPDVKQPPPSEVMKGKAEYIMSIYPSTHGQALNGLSKFFTETIYTWRNGNKYFWAGDKYDIHTSVRRVPRKDELEPDFSKYPIFLEG